MSSNFDSETIAAAIEGYEAQRTRIEAKIRELRSLLGRGSSATSVGDDVPATGKRRKFSAAARQRMKEAQQRRWAKTRGESPAAPSKPTKAKRQMSKAGRAAIALATKKRWAEYRAAKKLATAKNAG